MNTSQSRTDLLLNSIENCPSGRIESTGSSSGSSGESLRGEIGLCPSQRSDEMVSSEMTPEQKLAQSNNRVQKLTESDQCDACLQEIVRFLALTRLVYGDGHLKQAEAYARLAKAYLKFKGWAAQAHEHASRVLSLLPLPLPSSTPLEEQVARLTCLLSAYQTRGEAAILLGNLVEAESFFIKAEGILGELRVLEGVSPEESTETELEISTNLSRVYHRQGRSEEALAGCQRVLELQQETGKAGPDRTCSILKDMATIEQAQGRLDKAIEHLLQAHAIALSQSPGGVEGAHIAHSLALAYSSSAEPHHNDSAAHYFEESLSAYRSVSGPEDATTLRVLDDYCRYLLQTGQQERSVTWQRESLALKRSTFGDLSAEVAETLQLIGGVEMTQGHMKQAHKTMSKCLEVQTALYGPQHKKTRATLRTVNMLSQAPGVCAVHRREGNLQTRPPFCAVVPSPTVKGIYPNLSSP